MYNMRTTLDIDGPILSELKALQEQEGKSLGRLVSDLLARALKEGTAAPTAPLHGTPSRCMRGSTLRTRRHCTAHWMREGSGPS